MDILTVILWFVGVLLALAFLWELFKRLRGNYDPPKWKGQSWRASNGKTWDLPKKKGD